VTVTCGLGVSMKIAITGATGYIGRALVRACLTAGDKVVALSRSSVSGDGISWIYYDLSKQPEQLSEVEAIVHLAYDQSGKLSAEQEKQALLRLMAACKGNARFIFVSSQSAKNPGSEYGRRKRDLELATLDHGGSVVRPGLVYGGRRAIGLVGKLDTLSLLPVLPVPGKQVVVQPVHVSVLAEAIGAIVHQDDSRKLWEFGGEPVPLSEFWRALAQARNRSNIFVPLPEQAFSLAGAVAGPTLQGSLKQMFRQVPLEDNLAELGLSHVPVSQGSLPVTHSERRAALIEGRAVLRAMGLPGRNALALATYSRRLVRLGLRPAPIDRAQIARKVSRCLVGHSRSVGVAEWRSRILIAGSAYEMTPGGSRRLHRFSNASPVTTVFRLTRAVWREVALKIRQYVKAYIF